MIFIFSIYFSGKHKFKENETANQVITLRKIISQSVQTTAKPTQKVIPVAKPSKTPMKNMTKNETAVKKSHLDQVLQIGETLKNKTLEKLSAIGVIKSRPIIKFISESFKLDLSITMMDLADFMKDTQNLNQVKLPNIDLKKNMVVPSSVNKSLAASSPPSNVSRNSCRCFHVQCVCCARILMKRLHLNDKACANFTLLPKFQVSLDDKAKISNVTTAGILCFCNFISNMCIMTFLSTIYSSNFEDLIFRQKTGIEL